MVIAMCFAALAVVGCLSCLRSLNTYRVSIVNVGSQKISVSDFELYTSHDFSTALGGEFWPGQRKGCGPYNRRPNQQTTVAWKVMDTGETVSQTVQIELPERFKDYRSGIMFYVDPDNKRVYVAYDLHDDAKNIDLIVDSDGNPFDINQVKGTH